MNNKFMENDQSIPPSFHQSNDSLYDRGFGLVFDWPFHKLFCCYDYPNLDSYSFIIYNLDIEAK